MRTVEPIAIVGIGCRLPGGVRTPEQLWRLLADSTDAITEVPDSRWHLRSTYHPDRSKPGRMNSRWGGFLDRIDRFDAQFFGISPREAALLDPQQRILLEVAFEAVEDAGLTLASLAGKRAGVYVGISTFDYATLQLDAHERSTIDAYTTLGGMLCMAANRISYFFNLIGSSLALDSACSSSLVAVDLACRSIWDGQSELAFAAGVNAMLRPEGNIGESKASMLSPEGRCKSFGGGANGFVRGEGAAVVILKPFVRAVADRDHIYALVRATTVNQDGRTEGLTVPNPASQEANMVAALRLANIAPETIQYIEAHGTGTAVGDPIEAAAVGKVYGRARKAHERCLIGSIKSNLGHLEAGAGIVGLIKAALCLQYGQIPATLHFETPNPEIPFDDLRLQVSQQLVPWPDTKGHPARAGVNSFGAGGTNAHAILEAPPPCGPRTRSTAAGPWLLALSARSAPALIDLAKSYLDGLRAPGALKRARLLDICYSAGLKRSHHSFRMAIVAGDHEELQAGIKGLLGGEPCGHAWSGHDSELPCKPVFVCAGMGQQWWAMGRELMELEPVYRNAVEEMSELFGELAGWSLLDKLKADEKDSEIGDVRVGQPALFAVQAGLAALWRAWGIEPAAVIGHSAGEVAASYIAGALSLADAVQVTFHRSRLLHRTVGQGTMLAAGISRAEAMSLIEPHDGAVSLAAINGPRSVTLSGDSSILAQIDKGLNEAGMFTRILQVDVPFHSAKMERLRDELIDCLRDIKPQPAVFPFFSTATGAALAGCELDARYWYRNMREPVLFHETMGQVIEKGHRLFLEIGAHPVLRYDVGECLDEKSAQGSVLYSLRRGDPAKASLLGSLARLYIAGANIDWAKLFPDEATAIKLPLYPFQPEMHWHEGEQSRRFRLEGPIHPLLGKRVEAPQPTWSVKLDNAELDYLEDHRMAGAPVFPATGYIEMALGAAQQAFGPDPCILEDVEFSKILVLDRDAAPLAQIVLDTSSEFKIHVRSGAPDHSWSPHAYGIVRPADREPPADVDIAVIQQRCRDKMEREELYRLLTAAGLEYGPSFQGVATLWRGEREALAEIGVPDALCRELEDYRWHPAVLDACLQPALATLPISDLRMGKVFVPVKIERLRFYARPPERIFSHARVRGVGPRDLTFDIQIISKEGAPLADIVGLVCRSPRRSPQIVNCPPLYEYQWKLAPRPAAHRFSPLSACLDGLAPSLRNAGQALWRRFNRARFQTEFQSRARSAALAFVVEALRELGWKPSACAQPPIDKTSEELAIAPRYRALVQLLLKELGTIGDTITADRRLLWKSLWNDFPECQAETMLLRRCGSNLASVLRGEMDPLNLIFPDNSLFSAEHLYQNSATFRFNNLLVQEAVVGIVNRLPPGKTLRILEIGGGTGGMTGYVLPVLPTSRTEYVYTDISVRFIAHAQRKFAQYSFVQYRPLDIAIDPIEQGFVAHSFDLIIASDVLHATRDLRSTLEQVKTLLASGGCLLLVEVTRPWLHTIVSFGLLKGWWLFEDHDLRSEGPCLSIRKWMDLLAESGFNAPVCVADCPEQDSAQHAVFLACAPQFPATAGRPLHVTEQPKYWLVFADTGTAGRASTGGELALQLRQRGDRVIQVRHGPESGQIDDETFNITPRRPDDLRRLLESIHTKVPQLAGIVYLWSLDIETSERLASEAIKASADLGFMGALRLVQAIAATNLAVDSLWLVTRATQRVARQSRQPELMQSPLWGLGRVVNNEYPRLHCRLVDLATCRQDEIAFLVDELNGGDESEDEIALDGELRYVHRLAPVPLEHARAKGRECCENGPSFRFELQRAGFLDSFAARHLLRPPPKANEIEIEIGAAALNFRDLMLCMGMLPPDAIADDALEGAIGLECAGRVVALGEGVSDFALGDEVVSLGPGNFASHVTVDTERATHKPGHLSLEDAATIPVAFVTAFYALHTLGQLQSGERVLIHSAAGGVGLAAVQLALKAGAVVFATAGSSEKRELLSALGVSHVMDSRSLAFGDEVIELTQGEGIDLVLNSLAGDAIEKSLALLRPFGRFVEIGKADIYRNHRLGMRFLRKDISMFVVDLSRMLTQRPKQTGSLLHEILRQFERNELRPLPQHVFAASHVGEAFQCMAKGRHIGKLLVSMHDRAGLPVEPEPRHASIAADASYLITGGLGGFGLAVADHLARRGARHIALIGRNPPSSSAQLIVESMRHHGVEVMICQADIVDRERLSEVLADVQRTMPALRGVIHAAMVLDDAPIEHLTNTRMWSAIAPKMLGAWNLHSLTSACQLDFFILFSSIASILGNPGQANYAAGNMFLDALSHYRRSRGLPAVTLNWGVVGGTGHFANNPEASERVARLGVKPVPVSEMLNVLDMLMFSEKLQLAVAEVDWNAITQVLGARIPARLAELMGTSRSEEGGSRSRSDVRAILGAEEAALPALLESYLRDHLARAMGASPARIDVRQPLLGLGLDSLIAVDVRNRVRGDLSINVPLTVFMQGATIQSVAAYIAHGLTERNRSRPCVASHAGEAQAPQRLSFPQEDARAPAA